MPRFTVLITRDVTESTSVTVEAADAEGGGSCCLCRLVRQQRRDLDPR